MTKKSFHYLIKRYFILATTIPVLLFSIYIYSLESFKHKESTAHSVDSFFKLCETRMHDFYSYNSKLVELFATDSEIKNALDKSSEGRIDAVIARFDSAYSLKGSIALGLSDGRMFTKNKALLPEGYDPRVRPWYISATASDEKINVSDPYPDAINAELFRVTFSTKVFDDKNELIGITGLDVDMSELLNFGEKPPLPPNSIYILTDKNGDILAKTENLNLSNESINMIISDISKATFTHDKGLNFNRKLINGNSFSLFAGPISIYNWRVVVLIPNEILLNQQRNIIIITLLIIFIMITSSIFASQKIDKIITTPLDKFLESIETLDINLNSFYFPQIENETYEIETIREAINKMLERIYDQRKRIENSNLEISKQYMEIEALYEETTAMNDTLNDMLDSLNNSWKQTVRALSNAIEANDIYTRGHCDRVTEYSLAIANQMGIEVSTIKDIEFAAMLHDVGKVSIPYHILNKADFLTPQERTLIEKHPEIGYTIIDGVQFLSHTANIILHHHERFDGTGYPHKLSGQSIPIESRILSVADAFDAMTSARPYRREPASFEYAVNELKKNSGTQFDPKVVEAFIKYLHYSNFSEKLSPSDLSI